MRNRVFIVLLVLLCSCNKNKLELYFFDHEFYTIRGVDCDKIDSWQGVRKVIVDSNDKDYEFLLSVIEIAKKTNDADELNLDNRDKFYYKGETVCSNISYLLDAKFVVEEPDKSILKDYLKYKRVVLPQSIDVNPINMQRKYPPK